MINAIFVVFIFGLIFRKWTGGARFGLWVTLSFVFLVQEIHPTLIAVFALLLIQEGVYQLARRTRLNLRFLPLLYATVLIVVHAVEKLNITGFSYLVLASSIDLWLRLQNTPLSFKKRLFNLISFPKASVGPITSAQDHLPIQKNLSEICYLALKGILKGLILVNLWREFVPAPIWTELSTPLDYFWFGTWNYIHLYLEFSGACDLVAATFWIFGFGCPLNFDRPYLSLSVTEFWKRWHITLGLWIRNYVYIPFGGSRVPQGRIFINLIIAMTLCGAWHGLSLNFIAWGFLQGIFLCGERLINLEQRLKSATKPAKFFSWAFTQILVIISWIVFFGS